jgi:hypothetical protein
MTSRPAVVVQQRRAAHTSLRWDPGRQRHVVTRRLVDVGARSV